MHYAEKGCEMMKRIYVFFLVLTLIISFTGCNKTVLEVTKEPASLEISQDDSINDSEAENTTPIDFVAQYIRTDGYQDGAKYPKVEIIENKENLAAYYITYREIYNLERRDAVYSDTSIGFLDACDQYTEEFFQENYLIFVLLEEGSGSISHEVERLGLNDTQTRLRVDIHRDVPEVGTADMAEWHIILELNRDNLIESPNDIHVYLDGTLFFDGVPVETPYEEPEPIFDSPPNGWIFTPDGKFKLAKGGRNWTYKQDNGEYLSVIADQAGRPMEQRFMETVTIDGKHLETVYAPVPDSDIYEATNSLGCLLKLDFEAQPDSVTLTCWPDTVWQDSNAQEEDVISHEGTSFYAKPGGYVYEITASWNQGNYYGTANYYVHMNVEVGS